MVQEREPACADTFRLLGGLSRPPGREKDMAERGRGGASEGGASSGPSWRAVFARYEAAAVRSTASMLGRFAPSALVVWKTPPLTAWKMSKRRRDSSGSSYSRNGADSNRGVRSNGYLDFASSPMGVGESRLAFRCRVRGGCYRGYTEGSYCICKVFKPEDRYSMVDEVDDRDVSMQLRARQYAEEFNAVCRPTRHGGEPCNVIIRDGWGRSRGP